MLSWKILGLRHNWMVFSINFVKFRIRKLSKKNKWSIIVKIIWAKNNKRCKNKVLDKKIIDWMDIINNTRRGVLMKNLITLSIIIII